MTTQMMATRDKTASISAQHIALDMGLLLLKAAQAGVVISLILAAAVILLS